MTFNRILVFLVVTFFFGCNFPKKESNYKATYSNLFSDKTITTITIPGYRTYMKPKIEFYENGFSTIGKSTLNNREYETFISYEIIKSIDFENKEGTYEVDMKLEY